MGDIRKWLGTPAGVVASLIGLVTATAGLVTLFRTDARLAIAVCIAVALSASLLALLYVVFGKERDLIGPPRPAFSRRARTLASIGIVAAMSAGAAVTWLVIPDRPDPSRRRILICEFDAVPGAAPIHIRQRLRDDLFKRLRAHRIDGVAVEMDGTTIRDEAQARAIASKHDSTAVIWGWSDGEHAGIRVLVMEPEVRVVTPDPDHVPWHVPGVDATIGTRGKIIVEHAAFVSMFVAGQLLLLDNRWAEGAAAFDEAMKLLPANAELHNAAIAYFFRARAMHFGSPRNMDDQTMTRVVCGYAEAFRIQPTMYQGLNNLGIALAQQFEYSEADVDDEAKRCMQAANINQFTVFESAAAMRPEIAAIEYNRLAAEWVSWYGYDVNDDPDDEFSDALRTVLKRDASLFGAHIMLGVIAFDRGDYAVAQREFELVARAYPEVPGVHANLAQAARCLGDRKAADEALVRELARNPHDQKAKISLAALRLTNGDPRLAATLSEIETESLALRAAASSRKGDFTAATELVRKMERGCLQDVLLALLEEIRDGASQTAEQCWNYVEGNPKQLTVHFLRAERLAVRDIMRGCVKKIGDVSVKWIRGHCLPTDPRAALERVFFLVADNTKYQLHSRRVRWAGAACPYVFIPRGGRWEYATSILVGHRGRAHDVVSRNNLPETFDGALLIREREPEISYVDHVAIQYEYADGRRETYVATISELARIDGRYRVLSRGDEIALDFPPPRSRPVRAWIVAKGYYIPQR